MVFHGLLGTCSFLKFLVCACFEKFCLLRDNPCIGPQECDEVVLKTFLKGVCGKKILSKYLRTNLPTRKKSDCFPLDNVILLLRNR